MSKIALKKHKTELYLTNTLTYPENVNERLLLAISKCNYYYLLPIVANSNKKKTTLNCNITGLVPIKSLFGNAISVRTFFHIIEQIITVVRYCEDNMLNISNLFFDINNIFCDRTKDRLLFVYWPIVNNQSIISLHKFLKTLPQNAKFVTCDNTSFLETYNAFFDGIEPFSLNKFENMVNALANNSNTPIHNKGTGPLDSVGNKRQNTVINDNTQIEYDPFLGLLNSSSEKVRDVRNEFASQLYSESKRGANSNNNQKIIVNEQEERRRSTRKEVSDKVIGGRLASMHLPYLIRLKNKEKIVISNNNFIIGKANQGCSYRVSDNNMVSRLHASFNVNNGKCFITDLRSTNKTYINNKPIPADVPIEIFNNDTIRLGNESFLLFIGN